MWMPVQIHPSVTIYSVESKLALPVSSQLSLLIKKKYGVVPLIPTSIPRNINQNGDPSVALHWCQRVISKLGYNYFPRPFFIVKKGASIRSLCHLAKSMTILGLPIKCLEAVVLGAYLTSSRPDLTRITVSFKSKVVLPGVQNGEPQEPVKAAQSNVPTKGKLTQRGNVSREGLKPSPSVESKQENRTSCSDSETRYYRHIILAINIAKEGSTLDRWGALGLSRRHDLMDKPFIFKVRMSLLEIPEQWGHDVLMESMAIFTAVPI
jgi:hypothetical protein